MCILKSLVAGRAESVRINDRELRGARCVWGGHEDELRAVDHLGTLNERLTEANRGAREEP